MSFLRIFAFLIFLSGSVIAQDSQAFTVHDVAIIGTAAPAALSVSSSAIVPVESTDLLRVFAMVFGIAALAFTYGYALFRVRRQTARR